MKHFILIAALMITTPTLAAQTIIYETDDAFIRSQETRAEAIKAFRAGDLTTALDIMQRALEDRPTSIALLGNAIFLAAEADNMTTALKLARRYAKLGVNPGDGIQEKLQKKLSTEDWEALEIQFAVNSKPIGNANNIVSIPTQHKLVEGIATDNNGNMFFSTVVSGTLLKADPAGNISVLFDGKTDGFGSFFGIAFDNVSNALYATFATIEQTPAQLNSAKNTGVVKIDPNTGNVLQTWILSGGSDGQQIADIAITNNGTIFVADAAGSKIYRIAGDVLKAIPTTARFMNPQGIVARGEAELLMADYGRGLWHIDANTGAAVLYGVPDNITLTGIDGLFAHKGKVIAVQNGTSPQRMIEIHLDDDKNTVTHITPIAQKLSVFDEPTLGTSTAGGIAFVASSQWPKFGAAGTLRDNAVLEPTIILQLPDENIR